MVRCSGITAACFAPSLRIWDILARVEHFIWLQNGVPIWEGMMYEFIEVMQPKHDQNTWLEMELNGSRESEISRGIIGL